MTGRERVHDPPVVVLGQVDVLGLVDDAPEHGTVGGDVLSGRNDWMDVPVLERDAVVGVDAHPLVVDVADDAGLDGVHGGAVRRRDVDALMEGEAPGPVEGAAHRRRRVEDGAGVTERPAHGVLVVEGLDRPAVAEGRRTGRRGGCAGRGVLLVARCKCQQRGGDRACTDGAQERGEDCGAV